MESHDEERLMYHNLHSGKTTPSYDVKNLTTALKMLWQFGEQGYDYSINHCLDGSNNSDCRVSPKPVKWEYQQEPQRQKLTAHVRDLIRLRNTYDVFTDGTATITGGGNLVKHLLLKNDPYTAAPTSAEQMNAVVVVNFDVSDQSFGVEFPHTGTWYDYYSGGRAIAVTGSSSTLTLKAGEYKLFTDYPIESPIVTGINDGVQGEGMEEVSVYPNPVENILLIKSTAFPIGKVSLYTLQGTSVAIRRIDNTSWDVRDLASGLYIIEIQINDVLYKGKIVKK
jgi:hypothetical protein